MLVPPRASKQVTRGGRFLFVDDDAVALRTWRRLLRRRRPQWEVYTAESGAAALHQLDTRTYDVVVSDLEMLEMNGLDLLRIVQRRWPRVVRMLFSGYASALDDESLSDIYHLMLDKSSSTEQLISALERCLAYADDGGSNHATG